MKASSSSASVVLLAGLAGGIAEVLWVSSYAALSPADAVAVAREITATVTGNGATAAAPWLGFAIHMILSVALAAAFGALAWHRLPARLGGAGVVAVATLTLAAIWAMNFFVVLPAVNPAFIALLPLSVTFVSKALFGLAMGGVLGYRTYREALLPA